MAKKEYHVRLPLTGFASKAVIAGSEEEAVNIFKEECTIEDVDWGVDTDNAEVHENDVFNDHEE